MAALSDGFSPRGRRDVELGVAVMEGLVQHQRLHDALEVEGTDLDKVESARRDVTKDVLPDEHLIRRRLSLAQPVDSNRRNKSSP